MLLGFVTLITIRNKLRNAAQRNSSGTFARICPLKMAPVPSELSGVNDLFVGGASVACLAG
jgi:hypothetical protein